MEQKKSKVTAIQENYRQYDGQNGKIYYHIIEFENGDKGQYGSKSDKCTKFTVGQESDYTIESKVSGNYTNYTIKPVQAQSNSFKSQVKNEGTITMLSCISSACIAVQQSSNSTNVELIKNMALSFFELAKSKSSI